MTPRAPNARWFHDQAGNFVVFQRPNAPLITWVIARLASLVTPVGWPSRLADIVGFGALFTWSWLEAFAGESRFRRVLGGVVVIGLVLGRVAGERHATSGGGGFVPGCGSLAPT